MNTHMLRAAARKQELYNVGIHQLPGTLTMVALGLLEGYQEPGEGTLLRLTDSGWQELARLCPDYEPRRDAPVMAGAVEPGCAHECPHCDHMIQEFEPCLRVGGQVLCDDTCLRLWREAWATDRHNMWPYTGPGSGPVPGPVLP